MSDVVNSIRSQNAGAQLDIFRAGKDLWSYGTLIKHFVKYTSKKLHKYILNRKLDSKMDTIRVYPPPPPLKSEHFFRFSKKWREGLPPPCLVARLRMWMNMYQCLWISINILKKACMLWLCQGSEYTWSLHMLGRLLKMPQVLNVSELWIWHGCICKDYTEFSIFLNMAKYASQIPENASMSWCPPICLNIA